jgi:hydrogenase nickel incorporation protein HypB
MKVDLSKPILDRNERLAAENRALFDEKGVFVLDLLASRVRARPRPSSRRSRAARPVPHRGHRGDIASTVDAEKIKAHGIPAVQINTGGACHLESDMIRRAVDTLDLDEIDLLIIENVGNLVCPTDFDLGENAKVMILSVPEGHDKPYKYPNIFARAEAVILNKYDTLPVFDFDEDEFREVVRSLNAAAPIFPMSATKGGRRRVDPVARRSHRVRRRSDGADCRRRLGLKEVAWTATRLFPSYASESPTQPREPLCGGRGHHGGARTPPRLSEEDVKRWGLAGCCTIWTTPRQQRTPSVTRAGPQRSSPGLVDDEIVHAILAHACHVELETEMDRALYAADPPPGSSSRRARATRQVACRSRGPLAEEALEGEGVRTRCLREQMDTCRSRTDARGVPRHCSGGDAGTRRGARALRTP